MVVKDEAQYAQEADERAAADRAAFVGLVMTQYNEIRSSIWQKIW